MKRRIATWVLLLMVFLAVRASHAQQTSGNLVGNVVDITGAGIPHASVTAVNEATGVTSKTISNQQGEYRIANLLPGTYDVTATAPGFTDTVKKGVGIQLNRDATVILTASPAGANTTVEVTSDNGVALDTTTVQLQQTFSNEEVSVLPTSTVGLGVLNASLLSPDVATSGGIGAGTGPSVGGQRPRSNNFTIEGIDNNNKSITGPLVYLPNDAVGQFTLITNQFSPEFGHSVGGQFNTTVLSGTNTFHGKLYEYFQNRNLNAIDATVARSFATGVKPFNPRYDDNRYGGQIGGPVIRDKAFFFLNFERHTTGQNTTYGLCTPTAAGLATLKTIPGLNANNLAVYEQYMPASPTQISAAADQYCGNPANAQGNEELTVYSGTQVNSAGEFASGTPYAIPLGNYQVSAPNYTNFDALTTSGDITLSSKDSLRLRYLYNTEGTEDIAAYLPAFFTTIPYKYHLIAISEYHTFSPHLTNEARIGFNRYYNTTPSGNFTFPTTNQFPNLTFYDQGGINVGPDGNAPQSTIQNLYQFTDNITWVKGAHTFVFGFDGRKYISPQSFTQRVRGDYYWNNLTEYLHDLAPTNFGERSTGDFFYYGDQVALYGYANDVWRVTPTVTLNYGLRYEFTSVPVGERTQALNSAASVPGLINFSKPQPQYKNFAPRLGIAWSPDGKTSVRAGFGMGYDVIYDNLGILSFPPQFSSTTDVGNPGQPQPGDPNFLANGGLPAGNGTLATFSSVAAQRAATSAYVPNQELPYAETYSLDIQRLFGKNYTADIRYLGTRGIHLTTQVQINKESPVDATHFLPTYTAAPSQAALDSLTNTVASIKAARPAVIPAYSAAGFTSNITSFGPYAESNYNGLSASLVRRFQSGLQVDLAYTWSKTMDDATADVFSTVLTPRRPQNFQNVAADYSRSALDHTNRLSAEMIYDLPFFKNSNWLLKNVVGNWEVAPIYTYQSPEYATVQSADDANLNGDSAPDRTIINPNGVKGTGSDVTPLTNSSGVTVAYLAKNPNAYYIRAQLGALANASRNTLPLRPTDDLDATAVKRINFTERLAIEFQAQAFNVLNHPQFISGYINQINSFGDTGGTTRQFLEPQNNLFNHPEEVFPSNARTLQLAGKLIF